MGKRETEIKDMRLGRRVESDGERERDMWFVAIGAGKLDRWNVRRRSSSNEVDKFAKAEHVKLI